MVNRRRSTGFFLILLYLVLLTACSGNHSPENATAADAQVAPDALKIMPIGDSITQGDSKHQSYRYALWKKLVDSGVAFDLQGSMRGNYKGNPDWPDYKSLPFDRDHEGHWGWRVDEVLAEIDHWLEQSQPDVVLIHLGTNDIFQQQSVSGTLGELSELVSRFRAQNPKVKLLLAEVIPSRQNNEKLDQLNAGIVQLAKKLEDPESPILIVDMGVDFDPELDTYDGVHPNDSGESKMADIWFDGLMRMEVLQ